MTVKEFLAQQFLGNTYQAWLVFLAILGLGWFLRKVISRFFSSFLYRFFKKFSEDSLHEEFVQLLVKPFQVIILLVSLYFAFIQLKFAHVLGLEPTQILRLELWLTRGYGLSITMSITWLVLRFVDFVILVLHRRALETEDKSDDQIILFLKDLIKVIVVILSLFFILGAIFHLNITSLIAGLGIGGLAVALAAQETLSNLLGSFIIFLDKPFKAGDQVNFNNITGTVEKVGFRSTQIRTLDKSLLTVPNKDLIATPLNNITLSPLRRVRFTIGLTYGTTSDQIKSIVAEISEVLKQHPEIKEDYNVSFSDFGPSSLDILVIYFVHSNKWDLMMFVKEEVNYKIMEIVERNGSSFAFPTQTIHLRREE